MIKRKGPKNTGSVSLTFDDGPHSVYTPLLCEVLARHQAKSTFFMTGKNLLRHRDSVKEMAQEGHEIGNHLFSHKNALFMSRKKCLDEVKKAKELIEDITGMKNRLLRPPYGIFTPSLINICKELGLIIVLWSVNSLDYRGRTHTAIAERVIKRMEPGSICLLHECHYADASRDYTNTVTSLEPILLHIAQKKLTAVTVGSLLGTDTERYQ